MEYMSKKNVLNLKHASSVRVLVLQDAITNDIVGKIIANFSDGGICTTQAFIWGGKFGEADLSAKSCGGSGYDKFNSCLTAIFLDVFDNYQDVKELDSGLINFWFANHGYNVTTVL